MHCTVLSGNEETAIRLGAALACELTPWSPRGGPRDDRCARIPEPFFGNRSKRNWKGRARHPHGMGFLGAGVILRDPKGHVTGLTTAATIWICAVLGIVCGLGYWCRPSRF
jgi:MgtC family